MLKTADSCPQHGQDLDLARMPACDEVIDLTVHRHTDPVNPCEPWNNPSEGGPPGRLVALMRSGLVVACHVLA